MLGLVGGWRAKSWSCLPQLNIHPVPCASTISETLAGRWSLRSGQVVSSQSSIFAAAFNTNVTHLLSLQIHKKASIA